jgi:hypothetical protein
MQTARWKTPANGPSAWPPGRPRDATLGVSVLVVAVRCLSERRCGGISVRGAGATAPTPWRMFPGKPELAWPGSAPWEPNRYETRRGSWERAPGIIWPTGHGSNG